MPTRATRRRLLDALASEERAAGELQGEELARRRAYDPTAAAARAGRAQFDVFREDLGRDIEQLRGEQVGRGRLRTGFGFEDEDRLIQYGLRDLNRALAQNALSTAGFQLRNIEGFGQSGAQSRGRYLDLLAGQRDAEIAEENYRRQRRARKRGGLGGILGGALGAAAGSFIPGVGTLLGGQIGSLLGGSAGRAFS